MQLISNYNIGIRFLLYIINGFSKHAQVLPLKVEKGITITNDFQNISDKSRQKSNNIQVEKGSELFYKRPIRSWVQDNDIEMYSTNNQGSFFCC